MWLHAFPLCLVVLWLLFLPAHAAAAPLEAGFAEADITPAIGDKPVYIAGFGQNRKATGVHDPLRVRTVVLRHDGQKIALASVDLVGLFRDSVLRVRQRLPGFTYVLVSSTHNHNGPDTLGLWGPNPFTSGIDADYLKHVENQIVKAVQAADRVARPVSARIGLTAAPDLLVDNREPYIKHDDLVALEFLDVKDKTPVGVVVQWNCHPETLSSKNTEITADFVASAVAELHKRRRCPVVYLTGTVGGLMTSIGVAVQDEQGRRLAEGTFEKTERYGQLLGQRADEALQEGKPIRLTPWRIRSREVFLPIENPVYRVAWQLGVLRRPAYLWTGDPTQAEPAGNQPTDKPLCLATEIGWLRLGKLDIACIPGEIYPELVLGKVQDPPDPGADFPDAAIEPAIYGQLRGPWRMIIGLANDEIGYIIPKRQWDQKPPFCYGRQRAQYGEINSIGPEAAPILCKMFREMVKGDESPPAP
ncbi:MAG: hypothetical protein ACK4RK_10225 [Gemmataceae bacterium]